MNRVFHVDLPKPEPGDRLVNIEFKKKAKEVEKIKKCLPHLKTNKEIGAYSFDYLLRKECQ